MGGHSETQLIRPRCVISHISSNTIVNLLPNRDKKTVINYLGNLDGRRAVQTVAMDMWAPDRDAVQSVMPNARIVIDKFHVVRMANDGVEKVRKSLRESLTPKPRRGSMHDRLVLLKRERDLGDKERLSLPGWTSNDPELGEAYRLKEVFYGIYEGMGSADQTLARDVAWHRGDRTALCGESGDPAKAAQRQAACSTLPGLTAQRKGDARAHVQHGRGS